jgi:signal recognition particle receptor subunit beta
MDQFSFARVKDMKSLTIKTHSRNSRDSEYFQAILTLAGSVLLHDWRFVEHDFADVIVVSFDSVEPYSAWDEYVRKYSNDRLVAYTDIACVNGAKWHLQREQESIPRLSDVVRVLNNIGLYIDSSSDSIGLVQSFTKPKPTLESFFPNFSTLNSPLANERFIVDEYLSGILIHSIQTHEGMVCQIDECPPVYFVPDENAIYTHAESKALALLCRCAIDSILITPLTSEELREEITEAGLSRRQSMTEFLWFSILAASNGRLLSGLDLDEPVYLREWPGFARLSFYSMYQDIAIEMSKGMTSLESTARFSGAPIQNVIDFHNACTLLGLIARGAEGHRLALQKVESQEHLRSVLRPIRPKNGYLKLVIVGCVGSGKTTAITALSDTIPILTEANPSDTVARRKATTTIAMEYGEFIIDRDYKLQIYGTPGQKRFDFMGQILCHRAWGLLILIDNLGTSPLEELKYYLDSYSAHFPNGNMVIGISHYDRCQIPDLEQYEIFITKLGFNCPVFITDSRDIQSLVLMIVALAELTKTF